MKIEDKVAEVIISATKTKSLREISRELEVDVSILSKWVRGKRSPSLDTLNRVMDWAGLDLKKTRKNSC